MQRKQEKITDAYNSNDEQLKEILNLIEIEAYHGNDQIFYDPDVLQPNNLKRLEELGYLIYHRGYANLRITW